MAPGKGDGAASQGCAGCRGTHGRGEGPAPAAAPAHAVGVVLFAPPAAIAGVPPNVNRAAAWEARDCTGMAGAHRSTVVEVVATYVGADIQPMLQVPTAMAPGKGDRAAGQG